MASFNSVLSDVGNGLKHFFTGAIKVATAAEPLVDAFFPGIAPLFNSVVAEIGNAEAAAIVAGSQNGTGPQKLAMVTQAVEQHFVVWANANGYKVPEGTEIQNAVNAAVAFVNSLSAEKATPAAPAP